MVYGVFLFVYAYPICQCRTAYPIAGVDEARMASVRWHQTLPPAPRRLITHADWGRCPQASNHFRLSGFPPGVWWLVGRGTCRPPCPDPFYIRVSGARPRSTLPGRGGVSRTPTPVLRQGVDRGLVFRLSSKPSALRTHRPVSRTDSVLTTHATPSWAPSAQCATAPGVHHRRALGPRCTCPR